MPSEQTFSFSSLTEQARPASLLWWTRQMTSLVLSALVLSAKSPENFLLAYVKQNFELFLYIF